MIYYACPDPLAFVSGGNLLNAQIFRAFREAGRAFARIGWQDIPYIDFAPKDFLLVDSIWINKIQIRDFSKIKATKIFFTHLLPSMLDLGIKRIQEIERLSCFDFLLANSAFTRNWLDALMSGKSRIKTVQPWIKKTGMQESAVRDKFILVAAWQPIKQIDLLFDTLTRVDLPKGFRIHCYGDRQVNPSYTFKCMQILEKHPGLAEHILLEGVVSAEHLASVYVAGKCLIDSSRFETYGMALAEGLVNGLQVLALGQGNVIHLIGQGRGKYCRDLEELVQTAVLIFEDKLSLEEKPVQDILTSWSAFVSQFSFLDQIGRI
ncbi:MAG TPA: hypothetical protein PKM27_04975 [Saprospiraceae bacterium]|nr:hypothetical protein [Saprospiraceae bacterium]